MDLIKADKLNAPFNGMMGLPILRQLGLLLGLAVSIALGVYIVQWAQTPQYTSLYGHLSGRDIGEVVEVLKKEGIEYRLDDRTGALTVDTAKIHEARLSLAAKGLPHSAGPGFELMEKDQGFGSSTFLQNARYHRAQEGELARTIMSMSAVESARVHLALPRESAFVRDHRKASASVLVSMASGRRLDAGQVSAIIHLVASSVQNMEAEQVTIVDSKGRLLSSGDASNTMALSASQFDYTQKLETSYIDRIERLLSPIVGLGKVRAQVSADIDFTRTELTQETFNPDQPSIRSEQRVEEQTSGSVSAGGVPGALSNEPPGAAQAPQQVTSATAATPGQLPKRSKTRLTRNFELDKTISHTRRAPGSIRRLSVAVIIDNKEVEDDEGDIVSTPYTPEELTRFNILVKEAVGFNVLRGDTVNIINIAFTPIEEIEPPPELSFMEQPWLWDVVKQAVGGLLVLLLLFGVLRPVMHGLATRPGPARLGMSGDGLDEDQLTLGAGGNQKSKYLDYETNLSAAQTMVGAEPKRVAQVVKGWVDTE